MEAHCLRKGMAENHRGIASVPLDHGHAGPAHARRLGETILRPTQVDSGRFQLGHHRPGEFLRRVKFQTPEPNR